MSDIGTGGSNYPVSLPTANEREFDKALANRTKPDAQLLNDIKDEIVGIAGELGLSLKGSAGDLATRLANYINDNGTFKNGKLVIGSTSYATLSDAITALTSSGGEIFLPTGTEDISTTTQEIKTKARLSGSGKSSIITNSDGDTKLLTQDADANIEGASFDNLELDGASPDKTPASNSEGNHAIGLYASGQTSSDNIVGPNIWIKDVGGDGLYLRQTDRNILHNLNIDVNWQEIGANLTGRNGIAVTDGDVLVISNCIIRRAAVAGIDLEPNASETVKKVIINNCVISESLHGISLVNAQSLGDLVDVSINNCHIDVGNPEAGGFNATTRGINLTKAQNVNINNCVIRQATAFSANESRGINIDQCNYININNCAIVGCARGIHVEGATAASSDIIINGCQVYGNYKHGLSLAGTSGKEIEGITVNNNRVWNNDLSQGNFDGIRLSYADKFVCMGNTCYDDQVSKTQNSGIQVDNCDIGIIANNICYDNVSAQIRIDTVTGIQYGHNIGAVTFV